MEWIFQRGNIIYSQFNLSKYLAGVWQVRGGGGGVQKDQHGHNGGICLSSSVHVISIQKHWEPRLSTCQSFHRNMKPVKPIRLSLCFQGLPWWPSWQRIHLQCRSPGFPPWVGKIPLEESMTTHSENQGSGKGGRNQELKRDQGV